MSEKLMLIDGHSILNRAFYGVPDLTNNEGIHTNALYGFLNMMFRFIDEENPDYLTVAFDLSAPTFRHLKYDAYKGTRKPMAPELKQQVPLIKEILKAMNICIVQKEGFEADDIIGTLAKTNAAKGIDVSVISGDRDLLQLADSNIKIRIPKTKKGVTEVEDYFPDDVIKLYGVSPLEFIDMKALMGDSSDNIPGAPGVGPKTAGALIQKYHNIDAIFEDIENVKPPKAKKSISENEEQVRMSRFLAEIKIDVPIEYSLENAKAGDYFNTETYDLFKRFNFKSLLKRFEGFEVKKEFDAGKYFKNISDYDEACEIFDKAYEFIEKGKNIGFCPAFDNGHLYGVSICFSETENYYISTDSCILGEGVYKDKIVELAHAAQNSCLDDKNNKKGKLLTLNLKNYLGLFSIDSTTTYLNTDYTSFMDLAIGAYLINPNNEMYSYDTIASEYLKLTLPSQSEMFGKKTISQIFEDENSQEIVFPGLENLNVSDNDNKEEKYHLYDLKCMESYVCLITWEKLESKLKEQDMFYLYEKIEMPLIFVLYEMQEEGIRVNSIALKEYSEELGSKLSILEKEIYEAAGEEFNINSPKQLGVILFEKLGMPNGKKTKSGYSTAAGVLEKLAPEYPFVQKILDYRQIAKLKSTYADGLAAYISKDGRIHGTFNQTITATGRISSTDPNLQNIPIRMELGKKIREVFIPEDGYVFLDADYSQIELRILAHMSDDEKLIEAYNQAQDIHRITASQVFNVPFEDVTSEQRRNAKAVNFGIVYGISSFGLSQDLSISRKEADLYIKKYFETYPQIKKYIDDLVESAKEKGYSLTMYNRRRPIPEIKSSNFMQRSFGERIAMNAPIQGTAADIIKLAMIRVYTELKTRNLKSKLLLQVHDELLVETAKDEIEEVKELIIDSMKNAAKLKVILDVDIKQGNNWLQAH